VAVPQFCTKTDNYLLNDSSTLDSATAFDRRRSVASVFARGQQ
jgi:hypothetical protein